MFNSLKNNEINHEDFLTIIKWRKKPLLKTKKI